MKITPVNEPRGEGNGWEPCAEDKATSFELDNGKEIVGLFDTRKDAEFAADAEGEMDRLMAVLNKYDFLDELKSDADNLIADLLNLIGEERAAAVKKAAAS